MSTLSKQQICDAINKFGSGQHPYADLENLSFFKQDYIDACVRKAQQQGEQCAICGRNSWECEHHEE